jgi:SPRY domain-containing SOCS box protein 3
LCVAGQDAESWGLSYKGTLWHNGQSRAYCAPFYDRSTVIGVYLDLYRGTLSYFLNGTWLGEAYTNLPRGTPLYPMISSTADCTELEVVRRSCRYLTLQEKCCLAIAKSLKESNDAAGLPLPWMLKHQVQKLSVH